jgi:CheY-like chemotaxis protein
MRGAWWVERGEWSVVGGAWWVVREAKPTGGAPWVPETQESGTLMSDDLIGYVLSDDLIFNSRITGTARDLGLWMVPARSAEVLAKMAEQRAPRCVIVDLANPGLDLPALMQRLAASTAAPRVVAYGSHVDTATLKAARDAGCDPVLPRSKFVEVLPTELPAWFS